MNLKKRLSTLLRASIEAQEELRQLTEGESCDHSVGICWCGTFRRLNALGEAIHEIQKNHPELAELEV